jgi:DNA polymerase-3 subunit delta'
MENDLHNPTKSLKLIGLEMYLEEFVNLYNKRSLPKVLMLSGEKGIGKFTLVNHLLNYIFHEESYDMKNKLIDKNSPTFNRIINNSFSNVIYLKNFENNSLKIEDIRKLKSKLFKSTLEVGPRFIVLDDVEFLNNNCINALLKIIEEPTRTNFFILINNKQRNILETVTSRCISFNIFQSSANKKKVIEYLISNNNLEDKFNWNSNEISPGFFLYFNELYLKNKISEDTNIMTKIIILMNQYKKDKNKIIINLIIYLIDRYFYKLIKNKNNEILIFINKKNNVIKTINEFVQFNLNTNSVISLIEKEIENV